MPQSKQVFAFLLALSLCLVAIWREMQALAIVAFLLSVLAIHRRQSMLLFDQGMSLLSRTKQAKLGDLEVQIDNQKINLTERLEKSAVKTRILLDGLDSDHVGWLLTIHRHGRYEPPAAIKEKLRQLRNRGLLLHDSPSMQDAKLVWLSPLGEELVVNLLTASPELRQKPVVEPTTGHG